ncbi:MAG: 2-oxo-4-hydroxy-4-carboxy-5-ureidoimidazoline decarboxylase [Acetobacteraceae bacterium]|nr:2-oxo-4-hydroxy-4-carboxy-5-ureidoimidazoline decarboxylase [Acetobacteraceae bacterium]MSP30492.1 2-oxo-4-hydroxy-4-carboxy-5-ureidoimidazoline decarboxylase [Acetobacteraceae bacterium]
MVLTLDQVNALDEPGFLSALGDVFEGAPWVAERAWYMRPFTSITALHQAMYNAVRGMAPLERIAWLNTLPDLGAAMEQAINADAVAEHDGLALEQLDAARLARLRDGNAAYRARLGFPFILCARRHTRASLFHELAWRLRNDLASERACAMDQVFLITRLRIADRVSGSGLSSLQGGLRVLVLDSVSEQPVADVPAALFEIDGDAALALVEATTNAAGGTDVALLSGAPLRIGQYELRVGPRPHFAQASTCLDVIPIRFSITEPEAQYLVTLLVGAWGYSIQLAKERSDG